MMDLINAWLVGDYVSVKKLLQEIYNNHHTEDDFVNRFFFITTVIYDEKTRKIAMKIINSGQKQYAYPMPFPSWNQNIYYIAYFHNSIDGYRAKNGLIKNVLAARNKDYGGIVGDEKCWQYLPSPFREICAVHTKTAKHVTTTLSVMHELLDIEKKIGKKFIITPDKFVIMPETLEEIFDIVPVHPVESINCK